MRTLSNIVDSEWFNGSFLFACRGVINKQGYQCQGMSESTYNYYVLQKSIVKFLFFDLIICRTKCNNAMNVHLLKGVFEIGVNV